VQGRHTRAFPLVISGPSGVGKTSIVERVLAREPGLRLSVSATTRKERAGEVGGQDYWFLSGEEFEARRAASAFVEWAEVHGALYGTPREPLERWLADGHDVLLDIDYQGGLKIKAAHADAVLVFLLPPSWQELKARLRGRRSDADAEVGRRLENAAREIAHTASYDYFVVNAEIDDAVDQVLSVLRAERQRVSRLQEPTLPMLGERTATAAGRRTESGQGV
jgi:guanylate kinase